MAAPVLDPTRYDTEDGLPDQGGCVRLVGAFWQLVHHDLAFTSNPDCRKTVAWLQSPEVEPWCAMAGADPEAVRASFAEKYPRSFALYGRKAPDGPPDQVH